MTLTRRLGLGRLATCTTFGSFPPPAVASNSVVSYKACVPSSASSALRFQLPCFSCCQSSLLPRPHWIRCSATHMTADSWPQIRATSLPGWRTCAAFATSGLQVRQTASRDQLTHYTLDDGQELTQLTFSADASQLLYVRGGDHDANWPAQGNLAPNPDNNPSEAKVTIWSVSVTDSASTPVQVAEGDSPALSPKGQLAYVKDGQIWTAPLPGEATPQASPSVFFLTAGKTTRRSGPRTERGSPLCLTGAITALSAYT